MYHVKTAKNKTKGYVLWDITWVLYNMKIILNHRAKCYFKVRSIDTDFLCGYEKQLT